MMIATHLQLLSVVIMLLSATTVVLNVDTVVKLYTQLPTS